MTRSVGWLAIAIGAVACGGDEKCTTEGAYSCDGDVLQVCTDGVFVDDQDCAAEGQICHAEMGHCMVET